MRPLSNGGEIIHSAGWGQRVDYQRLDRKTLEAGARRLARGDKELRALIAANGYPPLWARRPGFGTLVQIILEQQVSLDSAAAVYAKLSALVPSMTPANFLRLGDEALRRCGFSRQKARYCRELAARLASGRLRLRDIHRGSASRARELLLEQIGIGDWTADVYLLMVLRHPDVWPPGDIALIRCFDEIKPRSVTRSPTAVNAAIESWRPYRSVAARILWHQYLKRRNRYPLRKPRPRRSP